MAWAWHRAAVPPPVGLADVGAILPQLAAQLEHMRREIHRLHAEVLALEVAVGRTQAVITTMQTHLPPTPQRPPREFTYDVRGRE